MNHIPPYLFLSREDGDDVGDIGKHDFESVVPHPWLSNAKRENERRDHQGIGAGGDEKDIFPAPIPSRLHRSLAWSLG